MVRSLLVGGGPAALLLGGLRRRRDGAPRRCGRPPRRRSRPAAAKAEGPPAPRRPCSCSSSARAPAARRSTPSRSARDGSGRLEKRYGGAGRALQGPRLGTACCRGCAPRWRSSRARPARSREGSPPPGGAQYLHPLPRADVERPRGRHRRARAARVKALDGFIDGDRRPQGHARDRDRQARSPTRERQSSGAARVVSRAAWRASWVRRTRAVGSSRRFQRARGLATGGSTSGCGRRVRTGAWPASARFAADRLLRPDALAQRRSQLGAVAPVGSPVAPAAAATRRGRRRGPARGRGPCRPASVRPAPPSSTSAPGPPR